MRTLTFSICFSLFSIGTVTGVSQFIKQHKPELLTIAVEPEEQMLLTEAKGGVKRGPQGPHKIQGMGAVRNNCVHSVLHNPLL
jgi:cysteine synthase